MISLLASLGAGVALAYLALPVLAWSAGAGRDSLPGSRHALLLSILGLAVATHFAPALMQLVFARLPVAAQLPGISQGLSRTLGVAPIARGSSAAHALAALGAVWALATLLACIHAVLRIGRLRGLLRRAAPAGEEESQLATRLARSMGLPAPRLLLSDEIGVPFAVSLGRAAIVLPSSARETLRTGALEFVLRHELTHIARGDPGSALLASLLQLPLALHPVARSIARELRLAREEAVDAAVARVDASAYAQTLIEVASMAQLGALPREAVFMSDSSLKRRIQVLLDPKPRRAVRRVPTLVAGLALGLAALATSRALAATSGPAIELSVGQRIELDLGPTDAVGVRDPEIARFEAGEGWKVIVTGVRAGHTALVIYEGEHERAERPITVK